MTEDNSVITITDIDVNRAFDKAVETLETGDILKWLVLKDALEAAE